jgi:hypothetical protein
MPHGSLGERIPKTSGRRRNFTAAAHYGRVAFELVLAEVNARGPNLMQGCFQAISLNQIRYILVRAFGEMKHFAIRVGRFVENRPPQRIEKQGLPIFQLPPDQPDAILRRRDSNEVANACGRLGEVRGGSEPS